MNATVDDRLASFWQPIEVAAASLATASPQTMAAVVANLMDLLAGDLILTGIRTARGGAPG